MEATLDADVGIEDRKQLTLADIKDRQSRLFFRYREGGEESAFTELVQSCHRSGLYLAFKFIEDSHLAEDLVQDCWIKIAQNDAFDYSQKFSSWFLRVVTNRCLDHLRREKRRQHIWHSPADMHIENNLENFAVEEDPLIRLRNTEELLFCIGTFSRKLQNVLFAMLAGNETADIAILEGISESTVRARLYQVRKNCDAALQKRIFSH